MNIVKNFKFKSAALLITVCVVFSNIVKAESEPLYLKNRSDFVQQVYSNALIGFAFEHKCNFLEKPFQRDFEKNINFATEIFQGYLLGRKIVSSPAEALEYTKAMALGTIRFSGMSTCDSAAEDRVNTGFETAKNFMSIVGSELKKEAG